MNYDIKPSWDTSLAIAFTLGTIAPSGVLNGLVYYAVKTTAGAPTAIAGKYIAGAKVANAATGLEYQNTGTTASPVFTVNTAAAINQLTGDVLAGPGTGSVAATLADTVKVYHAKVPVSSAEILALNATPKTLVAAPGAGKAIVPLAIFARMTFDTAAYDTNTLLQAKVATATLPLGDNAGLLGTTAGVVIQPFDLAINPIVDENVLVANQALQLTVDAGNPATGAGTMDVYVEYKIITL